MKSGRQFKVRTLVAVLATAFPIAGTAAPAARVDFATGNVTAVGSNGQSRTLAKGAQIEQGETIATNSGRAQLRFTDGAYVSLQPESEFRIDQYRYDGKADGSEKGFFSLLKGGLRTITGLVGRSNKGAYQVTTSVATIGIRGTEYTIQYGQSIAGTVGEGEINVCNGAGCLSVTNGESYYVQNQDIKPVLTNKRTDLPPPSPQNPPSTFAQGETVDENGTPCAITNCGTGLLGQISPANVAVVSESFSGGEFGSVFGWFDNREDTSANLSGSGLDNYEQGSNGPVTIINPVTVGNDGVIAWGTATGVTGGEFTSSGNSFFTTHWAVGTTPDMGPIATQTGTYSLLGGTAPTSLSTGQAAGTLNTASLTMDFLNGFGSLSMSWTLQGQGVSTVMSASMNGGSTFSAFTSQSGSDNANAYGFFAGANAARAGIVYQVNVNTLEESFIGAATLQQTGLTPSQLID